MRLFFCSEADLGLVPGKPYPFAALLLAFLEAPMSEPDMKSIVDRFRQSNPQKNAVRRISLPPPFFVKGVLCHVLLFLGRQGRIPY